MEMPRVGRQLQVSTRDFGCQFGVESLEKRAEIATAVTGIDHLHAIIILEGREAGRQGGQGRAVKVFGEGKGASSYVIEYQRVRMSMTNALPAGSVSSSLKSLIFTWKSRTVSQVSAFLQTRQLNSGMVKESSVGICTPKPVQAQAFWLLLSAVVMSKTSFQVSPRYSGETSEKRRRELRPSTSRACQSMGSCAGSGSVAAGKQGAAASAQVSQLQSFQRTTLRPSTKLLSHIQWFLKAQPQRTMMLSQLLVLSMQITYQATSNIAFSSSEIILAFFSYSVPSTRCTTSMIWPSCVRLNSPQDWYYSPAVPATTSSNTRLLTSDIQQYQYNYTIPLYLKLQTTHTHHYYLSFGWDVRKAASCVDGDVGVERGCRGRNAEDVAETILIYWLKDNGVLVQKWLFGQRWTTSRSCGWVKKSFTHLLDLNSTPHCTWGAILGLLPGSPLREGSIQLQMRCSQGTRMGGEGLGSCRAGRSSSGSTRAWSSRSSFLLSFAKTGFVGKGSPLLLAFILQITYLYKNIFRTLGGVKLWPFCLLPLKTSFPPPVSPLPCLLSNFMSEDHHEQLYLALRKLIPPPNPIIDKLVVEQPPPVVVPVAEAGISDQEEGRAEEGDSLLALYGRRSAVFEKWPQRQNCRNGTTFFASAFLERNGRDPLAVLGESTGRREGGLTFSSSYEGGNLLAAYRVGEGEYDLILQNDLNSGGYTQWFDFTASNGTLRGTVKINIVNLYKRESLFGQGLKPLTRSLLWEKGWRRGCHGVEYFASELRMEGRRAKRYRVLSFKYDFIREEDTVQFCYCLPYPHAVLTAFLSTLDSPKARVKYLGGTPLGKVFPLLRVSAEAERGQSRRAVVLLGRQHAGETPSSHILQAMVEELLLPTPENEFLLSRYNFYLFPMVNVDGVVLGNYRCNFHGLDLNRCWQLQDSRRHPEVGLVKGELRRIMKREQVELLLDLHGHSNRMNSFFYANSFGRHNLIFPALAARTTPFLEFRDCSQAQEENDRASTARVVLGNMIRETGSAYTYEVSLFGGLRNGKKVAFGSEHYQEIARGLLAAMYKMGVQLQKEERLLRESLYLRDIRKEVRRFEGRLASKDDAVSDQEAKKTSQIEEKIKISPERTAKKSPETKERQRLREERWETRTVDQSTQTECEFELEEYRTIAIEERPAQDRKKKLSFSIRKVGVGEQTIRKMELMSKLRVFGQTFAQESPFAEVSLLATPVHLATQTFLTCKRERGGLQGTRSSFMGGNFLGRRLGQPSVRRRERIYKSNSTRVTQAEALGQLVVHNRLRLY